MPLKRKIMKAAARAAGVKKTTAVARIQPKFRPRPPSAGARLGAAARKAARGAAKTAKAAGRGARRAASVKGVKEGLRWAKKNPVKTAAIGASGAVYGARKERKKRRKN